MGTARLEPLPLHSETPLEWADRVLEHPLELLCDHAHLERKAALNAIFLISHWPDREGLVETMSVIAREELEHLALVHKRIRAMGATLQHEHASPYARGLQECVRKGTPAHLLDRLLVAGLIEARSCERFERLAASPAAGTELADFYGSLCASERGHYKVFCNLARREYGREVADARFEELLAHEAGLLDSIPFEPALHTGLTPR